MYGDNSAYLEAMRGRTREDSVSGGITLASGEVVEIDDSVLVNNDLSLDERICTGGYELGCFVASKLRLSIYDSGAREHDFNNAEIRLSYNVVTEDGVVSVPLGVFYVDGSSVKRKRDRVTLIAFDKSILFDTPKGSISDGNAYSVLSAVCENVGVELENSEDDFTDFANYDRIVSTSSNQIQSNRDVVMWVAQLLGGYAIISRAGKLRIGRMRYKVNDPISREVSGDERLSIDFTDTRLYPKCLFAYAGRAVREYLTDRTSDDVQAQAASLSIPYNPLVHEYDERDEHEVNQAILDKVNYHLQRGIEMKTFGDPALECGELVMASGGSLDIGRKIVGCVTRRHWKYRQSDTVICDSPPAANERESGGGAVVVARSQLDKRIDSLLAGEVDGIGSAVSESSYSVKYLAPRSQMAKRLDGVGGIIPKEESGPMVVHLENAGNGTTVVYLVAHKNSVWSVRHSNGVCVTNASGAGSYDGDFSTWNEAMSDSNWAWHVYKKAGIYPVRGSFGNVARVEIDMISYRSEVTCDILQIDWGDGVVESIDFEKGTLKHSYPSKREWEVTVYVRAPFDGCCVGTPYKNAYLLPSFAVADWGDGEMDQGYVFYSIEFNNSQYQGDVGGLTISGDIEWLCFLQPSVVEIVSWGNLGLKSLERTFRGGGKLQSIASPITGGEMLSNISYCFAYSGLAEIPVGLFSLCPKIVMAQRVFCETKAERLPDGLFKDKKYLALADWLISSYQYDSDKELVIGDSIFEGCESLRALDLIFLYYNNVRSVGNRVFFGCSKAVTMSDYDYIFSNSPIATVGDSVFENCLSVRNFRHVFGDKEIGKIGRRTFANCVSAEDFIVAFTGHRLSEISSDTFLGCRGAKRFMSAFSSNNKIDDPLVIPSELFWDCNNAESFEGCFSGDYDIHIERDIFNLPELNPDVRVHGMFYRSGGNATGIAPRLWEYATNGGGCFGGCYGLDNYSEIPVEWK